MRIININSTRVVNKGQMNIVIFGNILRDGIEGDLFITWDEPSLKDSHVCIGDLVEKNRTKYRDKYLNWLLSLEVFQKGIHKTEFGNANLLWFQCVQSSNFFGKSSLHSTSDIEDVLKIIALEDYLSNLQVSKVKCLNLRSKVSESIRSWCEQTGILFAGSRIGTPKHSGIGFDRVTGLVKGTYWILNEIWFGWRFRGVGLRRWFEHSNRLFFQSYLVRPPIIRDGVIQNEEFYGGLPKFLSKNGIGIDWFYIIQRSTQIQSSTAAIKVLKDLNNKVNGNNFVTAYTFLKLSLILKVFLIFYIKSARLSMLFYRKKPVFSFKGFILNRFFQSAIIEGTTGIGLAKAIFYQEIFRIALGAKKTECGAVYVQENQNWEISLLHQWRKRSVGLVAAMPHPGLRFWDLRYQFVRGIFSDRRDDFVLPDAIVCGGERILEVSKIGYPKEVNVLRAEPLRYDGLMQNCVSSGVQNATVGKVLILGDYDSEITIKVIKIVREVLSSLRYSGELVFKAHPAASPLNQKHIEGLSFSKSAISEELLGDERVLVIGCQSTNGCLDAYLLGATVILLSISSRLNQSALERSFKRCYFCSGADELKSVLMKRFESDDSYLDNIGDSAPVIFQPNANYPGWNAVIGMLLGRN